LLCTLMHRDTNETCSPGSRCGKSPITPPFTPTLRRLMSRPFWPSPAGGCIASVAGQARSFRKALSGMICQRLVSSVPRVHPPKSSTGGNSGSLGALLTRSHFLSARRRTTAANW